MIFAFLQLRIVKQEGRAYNSSLHSFRLLTQVGDVHTRAQEFQTGRFIDPKGGRQNLYSI